MILRAAVPFTTSHRPLEFSLPLSPMDTALSSSILYSARVKVKGHDRTTHAQVHNSESAVESYSATLSLDEKVLYARHGCKSWC